MTIPAAITAVTITQSADPVVAAFSSQDSTTTVRLRACQMGLARLYAQLVWLEENPGDVNDLVEAGRAISRRMRAIKRLAELEIKEHRHPGHDPDVDLHGPVVKEVVALLVTKLTDVTNDVVSVDDAANITTKFKSVIEDDANVPWP